MNIKRSAITTVLLLGAVLLLFFTWEFYSLIFPSLLTTTGTNEEALKHTNTVVGASIQTTRWRLLQTQSSISDKNRLQPLQRRKGSGDSHGIQINIHCQPDHHWILLKLVPAEVRWPDLWKMFCFQCNCVITAW
ncbi:hypothetical protein FB451DRAFT_1187988 [Mycena latifolia]|nr:hypothetical protein FB451DRAFT_1187988 [Mycena latifolia]